MEKSPLYSHSKLQRATFPAMEAFQSNKRNMMGQMDPSPFGPFLLFHFGSQSHPPAIPGQWRDWRPSQLCDFPRAMPPLPYPGPMRTMDRSRSYQNKIYYVRAPMHHTSPRPRNLDSIRRTDFWKMSSSALRPSISLPTRVFCLRFNGSPRVSLVLQQTW